MPSSKIQTLCCSFFANFLFDDSGSFVPYVVVLGCILARDVVFVSVVLDVVTATKKRDA